MYDKDDTVNMDDYLYILLCLHFQQQGDQNSLSIQSQMKDCLLGSGSFAVVSSCTDLSSPPTAVKKVQVRNNRSFSFMLNESTILRLCEHPNIVSFHSSWFDEESNTFCIKMERLNITLSHINLKDDFKLLKRWVIEICEALDYLHKRGIIHRDIKPENMMLGFNGEVKLIDFGVSAFKWMLSHETLKQIGSPCFMAPELFLSQPYNEKIDIYSLGVCIYLFVHGERPFVGINNKEYWENTMKYEIKYNQQCPSVFKQLMNKMMAKTHSSRPTAREIINFLIGKDFEENANHKKMRK